MKKKSILQKAYNNYEFLNSKSAREIRILAEFLEPKARFEQRKVKDTIVFFGSARILPEDVARKNLNIVKKENNSDQEQLRRCEKDLENSRYYEDALELSKRLTEWSNKRYDKGNRPIICSGGGPGIMEAASKGAYLANGDSIGLNISLPYEQFSNPYIGDDLNFEFHYFFMRKFWFAYLAKAMVIFPGGFGTLDELMEVFTLIQTEKVQKSIKIIVYDRKFWSQIISFDKLYENNMICKRDLDLFSFCDSVDEMEEELMSFFMKQEKHTNNNDHFDD